MDMFVCLFSWFVVCLLFYTFILKGLKKADIFNYGIFLTTNLAKLSCGLRQLIATGESSIVFKITTSTHVLYSHFLSSAVQVLGKIQSKTTPVPSVATDTFIDLRSVPLSQHNYDTIQFITSS